MALACVVANESYMKRSLIKYVLAETALGIDVTVAGWVRTRRTSGGGFSFIEINDGSCFDNLQVVVASELDNYDSEILSVFPGSAIIVAGELVESQGAGQRVEVAAGSVTVCGMCDPEEYPLQKQRVSFERLREIAHLRPRTNTFGAVSRVRNALAFATHSFFQEQDFLYIHTPVITASDCEGAGEMFQVTTLPGDQRHVGGESQYSDDFFGQRTGLTVSGQLEGEAYACALGRIYTFGPTFRAENSNTRRHLAEFWMVEPEMAFADLADDADLAEDYLHFLFRTVLEKCGDDLEFFNERIDKSLIKRLTHLAESPFERISYTAAVEILCRAQAEFEYSPEWGRDLQSEHERYLAEIHFQRPVVVTDYPAAIKPFYMRANEDGRTVAALDVLLPGVGEIIGGSQREDRFDLLRERIHQAGLKMEDYWWYTDLRRFGSVPHAGFGLGFGRLVQFCTGMQNIRDAIPFPRTPGSIDF